MSLLDHFHPPLYHARQWGSSHHAWAVTIAGDLNARLPPNYYAESHIRFGIEIDVAGLRDDDQEWQEDACRPDAQWQPTAPVATIPFAPTTDEVAVLVYYSIGGPSLAAAIELISPANKDRPKNRDAFTTKCENFLHDGLGVLIVDVVTERRADLHPALLNRLHADLTAVVLEPLSAVAYHPQVDKLDIWREALHVGGDLPIMPFWLKTGPCLPVDLGATYKQTRRLLRISDAQG